MRFAGLLVAAFTIIVGIVGLISPDSGTVARRLYFATPVGLYAAGVVRLAMGLVVILYAPASSVPEFNFYHDGRRATLRSCQRIFARLFPQSDPST